MKKSPRSSAITKKDFKKLEEKVSGTNKKVGGLGKNVEGLGRKIGGLEKQVTITKVEVRKLSTKVEGIRNRIWFDMEKLKDEMKDEMSLLRNNIAGMKDEVVTEVKAMREEFTAHKGTHDLQQETIEDHEKRITSLEKPKFA